MRRERAYQVAVLVGVELVEVLLGILGGLTKGV